MYGVDTCINQALQLAAILHPSLGSIGDDEYLFAALKRALQQPLRALVKLLKQRLRLRTDIEKLE